MKIDELIPEPIEDRYYIKNKVEKQTADLRKCVLALVNLCEETCFVCRIHNPQHKDCTSCHDIEIYRAELESITGKPWNEIREVEG